MDSPSASPATATIVLIPGYWLGGWAWDAVVDRLRADGRHAAAVTLPGLDPDDAAREGVALADQVAAVRAVTDGLAHPPVVVAHSGGGAVLSGVLDAAPGSARRDVPTTIIACSIPSATILQLARSGQPMFAEVTHLTKLDLVDLPTGHWPMWSRSDDLARAIASAADQ